MTGTNLNASLVDRVLVQSYGLICYCVGVAGLAAIIAALAKQVPFGFALRTNTERLLPGLRAGRRGDPWGVLGPGSER